jgi:hypothetical protein
MNEVERVGVNPPLTEVKIPRDKRGRIRWKLLEEDPAQLQSILEYEVSALLAQGAELKHKTLVELGYAYLSRAVVIYYPNGYLGLRQSLGLPEGNKPKNFWARPDNLETIQAEARAVLAEVGTLSIGVLKLRDRADLVNAVRKHYPGGIVQLKVDLGVVSQTKPRSHWTPVRIEEAAAAVAREYGTISRGLLLKHGRADLEAAIGNHYPGGLTALKAKLEIQDSQKPHGYWSVENIQAEAARFIEQGGSLSQTALQTQGRTDLIHAIWDKYPGGIRQLQSDLGLEIQTRKPNSFWTPDTIRTEASTFYDQSGALTTGLLYKSRRFALAIAISKIYPGGMRQLQRDLGVRIAKQPDGYWTTENTEQEALAFYQANSKLTFSRLKTKNSGLWNAIRRYPGGIKALREKLGIDKSISSSEANQDLERLLEK